MSESANGVQEWMAQAISFLQYISPEKKYTLFAFIKHKHWQARH